MGTPEFAVNILKKLNECYEVILVVSQPNRYDKKKNLILTPVYSCANELNLKCVTPDKIGDVYDLIKSLDADILITAAYGQFVPTKILKLFKKCLNVHGSILPKYRGGAPIQRALMNGDLTTGISIIEMEKGMDSGVIYAVSEIKIADNDTTTSLFNKLSEIGADLLIKTIPDVLSGKNEGIKQDITKVTYAYNLSREDEMLTFADDAFMVIRKIRALSLEPGATFKVDENIIKVYDAKISDYEGVGSVGEVLSLKKRIVIMTKDKPIEIITLQLSGKKRISAIDFLNGQNVLKEKMILK